MPTHRFLRPFASGSRPTSDPYDSFLEREGLYRKHVPRDATSLFRVMSEQLYDSQEYREKIRKDCVNFMIKHRNKYEEEIFNDFEKYTRKMVDTQTPGTLLELTAMSHMFERNILLYRPFDLGVWFVNEPDYKKNPLLRVFCTNEGHFDSVYTKSHIMKAGFCQSIVYETLYKNVFKLPDIEYSVEVMLHSTNDQESNIVFAETEYANDDEYASHIVFEDGRKFELDRPEDTMCILRNPKLCHFHNLDFETTAKELANKSSSMFGGANSFIKSSLSDKHTSCVRQLLNDGITPYTYKVAKALDPDMYRNVEFDSWSDARRDVRLKYGWHLQIGEKCLISVGGEKRPLFGYIQDIDEKNQSCIVYVDELCEKRSVSIGCMRPVSVNAYEPKQQHKGGDRKYNTFGSDKREYVNSLNRSPNYYSDSTYDDSFQCRSDFCDAIYKTENLNRFTDVSNFKPRNSYELVAFPIQYMPNAQNMAANPNNTATNVVKNSKNRHPSGQNHSHVSAEKVQQVTIMKNEDKNSNANNNKTLHEQKPNLDVPVNNNNQIQNQNQQQSDQQHTNVHVTRDAAAIETVHQLPSNNFPWRGTQYYYSPCEFGDQAPTEMVPNQQFFTVPSNAYQPAPVPAPAPVHGYAAHPNQVVAYNYVPMQYGQWPAQGYVHAPAQPISYAVQPQMPMMRSDLLVSSGRPNYNANYSFSPMADDLPMHEPFTIRFYYNLGIEYWKHLQSIHGSGPLMAMIDGDSFERAPSEVDSQHTDVTAGFQQMALEDNNLTVTTPTPSKGNGKNYNESYTGRRGSSFRYKRDNRDNRPNPGQRFQGTFPGPTKTFTNRNGGLKFHGGHNENCGPSNGRNNSNYDSTPIKADTVHKPHQHVPNNNNAAMKRETLVPPNETPNQSITFGSNVPPFPYHLGPPPANVTIPRVTPPVQERSAGVSPHEPINEIYNSGQHYNQYNMYTPHVQTPFAHAPPIHHQMPTNFWMIQPPPNQANNQAQAQAQVQAQLNSSNVSNMSSAGSNPSN